MTPEQYTRVWGWINDLYETGLLLERYSILTSALNLKSEAHKAVKLYQYESEQKDQELRNLLDAEFREMMRVRE